MTAELKTGFIEYITTGTIQEKYAFLTMQYNQNNKISFWNERI